jgi:hypothetical protein
MSRASHVVLALATALALAPKALAGPVDLTDRVRTETTLADEIAAACARYCQGNRRAGSLRRVTAERLDAQHVAVRGEAALRSRQVQEPPALLGGALGGPLTLFDYTVRVEVDGVLDLSSCVLELRRLRVVDDRFGLADRIREHLARPHRVPDCQRLLRGV